MSEVLVLQPSYAMEEEEFDSVYEELLSQKEKGVVILPPGWNALLVPEDVDVVKVMYGLNHHVKDRNGEDVE